jgi:hypothetical protein
VTGTAQVAGAVSLAGTSVALGALCALHVARTGLSPLRDAVSRYGISPSRAWYRVMTIAMGVAGAGIAVALVSVRLGGRATTVVALVAIFSACRLVISWFPMDAPGSPRTTTGTVHGLLAIGTFVSIAAAAIRLCRVLELDPRLDTVANASKVLGWVMAALVLLLFLARLAPELRRSFGATERLLYLAILVWLAVIGTACATGHLGGGCPAWPDCVHHG